MWDRVIQEVDKNSNGTIDYDEFAEVMNRIVSHKYKNLASVVGGGVGTKFKKQFGRKLVQKDTMKK